ncbi:hypothetical protein [Mucilaginibacter sp. FT3.2]|uniref:hypothetical protein n=1 Tax=Mucilaginibacter sp. FT3.2 TaxID=2723090 RepID=UPI00161AD8A1|nr:hypothetical protein [Mucilaginibacter sp. FT3.2]MBB6234277.1 hypothetical protein [Mucilaginibacter sp. FT3.2]
MKKQLKLLALTLMGSLLVQQTFAQTVVNDEAIRYQEERMVFKQWDKNKFTPSSGFLGLNPYYWLTWGLMPGYKKTDLRPLGPNGPQTQRIALVATMNSTDNSYKLHSDTLKTSALADIANQSGLITSADPLWLLYYSSELKPVLDHSEMGILAGLPDAVRHQVITTGLLTWYEKELDILKERLDAARSTDMDRGSRIMAYHRLLQNYRTLEATWAIRTATAALNIQMVKQQAKVKARQVTPSTWTPQTDVGIANKVLADRKY